MTSLASTIVEETVINISQDVPCGSETGRRDVLGKKPPSWELHPSPVH